MNKSQQGKVSDRSFYDREEQSRHQYKIQKKIQNKKMMKDLDKALRNKDYIKLVRSDDY